VGPVAPVLPRGILKFIVVLPSAVVAVAEAAVEALTCSAVATTSVITLLLFSCRVPSKLKFLAIYYISSVKTIYLQ
jgi:hypothetical protein